MKNGFVSQNAKIGKKIGIKALKDVACIVKPETILMWFRKLVAKKFDGSKSRNHSGRPGIDPELESLVITCTEENPGWGYDRIAGALNNLGYDISDQSVGNILKRNTTWDSFIESHKHILAACDFLTAEVLTPTGLITYYILFFIHIGTRQIHIAGMTPHPDEAWMKQIARNLTMADWGFKIRVKYITE